MVFSGPAWPKLGGTAPDGLRPFEKLYSATGPIAPTTQRDILVWLRGAALDDAFDTAMVAGRTLAPVGKPALDLRGSTYHDSRDLIGFVDGTASPKGDARQDAALIPDGSGGTFAMSQQWIHYL